MSKTPSLTWGGGGETRNDMLERGEAFGQGNVPFPQGLRGGRPSQEQKATWEGGRLPVPSIPLEWLSLFKLEYCRLIVGPERKMMGRGPVLHGFSVFE